MKSSKSSVSSKSRYPFLTASGGLLYIRLRVRPRGSRNAIAGSHDGALAVSVTSPPVEDAANRAVVDFMAKELNIRRSDIEIVSGHKGRDKRIAVSGIDLKEAERIFGTMPPFQ